MINYGIPYMGSKSKIISSLAMNFPKAKNFYDLFGGGFAVSHYMLEKKYHKYEKFFYNEINSGIVELVKKAISGDFNYKRFNPEWISREEFNKRKDLDPYIRLCWSFGNNQKHYMFSEGIEPYKRSMHMAVVFDEFDDLSKEVLGFTRWPSIAKTIKQKRLYLGQLIVHYRKTKIPKILYQFLTEEQLEQLERLQQLEQLERLQQLEQLQQLDRLQQLQRLERLQQLERLNFTSLDYREVPIENDSIVYCDIPYRDTNEYNNSIFNHDEFFKWASSRQFPVFISEYEINDPRFKLIYTINKRPMFCNSYKIVKTKVEKLYWNGVDNDKIKNIFLSNIK